MRSYHPAKIPKIWIFPLCTLIRTQPISLLKLFLLYRLFFKNIIWFFFLSSITYLNTQHLWCQKTINVICDFFPRYFSYDWSLGHLISLCYTVALAHNEMSIFYTYFNKSYQSSKFSTIIGWKMSKRSNLRTCVL